MNYHVFEYSELKQEAKERHIKFYYVMRKAQLIQLLSMKELPQSYIIEKKRIGELREEARARGFKSIYRLNRSALVELLYPDETWSKNQHQHHNNANKHNTPKNYNP
jgi:predicted ATP-dependent Lon-type protease